MGVLQNDFFVGSCPQISLIILCSVWYKDLATFQKVAKSPHTQSVADPAWQLFKSCQISSHTNCCRPSMATFQKVAKSPHTQSVGYSNLGNPQTCILLVLRQIGWGGANIKLNLPLWRREDRVSTKYRKTGICRDGMLASPHNLYCTS